MTHLRLHQHGGRERHLRLAALDLDGDLELAAGLAGAAFAAFAFGAAAALGAGALCHCHAAPAAAAYPDRPVKLLIGFTAGSSADVSARIVAGRTGEIEEVHVLTNAGVAAKQVVRNVESALMAQLGVQDPRDFVSRYNIAPSTMVVIIAWVSTVSVSRRYSAMSW